jgi:hypothetical protein
MAPKPGVFDLVREATFRGDDLEVGAIGIVEVRNLGAEGGVGRDLAGFERVAGTEELVARRFPFGSVN